MFNKKVLFTEQRKYPLARFKDSIELYAIKLTAYEL